MEYTVKKHKWSERAMPLEQRQGKVPAHGFCNLKPAGRYAEVLTTGNGKISACVYGEPWEETVVYGHERLYFPTLPQVPPPPPLASHMGEIRRLIMEGKGFEAANLASDIAREEGGHQGLLLKPEKDSDWEIPVEGFLRHSGAALKITTDCEDKEKQEYGNYLRTLDVVRGETAVYWESSSGQWVRTGFVCRPQSVHIQRLTPPCRTSLTLKLLPFEEEGEHVWERMSLPDQVHWRTFTEGNTAVFEGWYDQTISPEGYAVIVTASGEHWTSRAKEQCLELQGEGELLLVTKVVHFETYSHESVEKVLKESQTQAWTYERCMEENLRTHGALMEASLLELDCAEDINLSVEELQRIQHSRPGLCQRLLEKLYDAGRYFLLISTGELPPLIGQWNINVNLQVCSGIPTNMTELMRPYFQFIEKNLPDFRVNAKEIFGCRGIVADIHPDMHNGLLYHFSRTWPHEFYTAGTGWMYHEFYSYYLATGDETFLREHVVPGLKEIAAFYEDFLQEKFESKLPNLPLLAQPVRHEKEKDENGRYLFCPCLSPENNPAGESPATVNAVMDIMVCREVLEHLLDAVEILGLEEPGVERWKEILEHLPVLLTDEEGGLKEWAWEQHKENYNHRCVSHHYDVWPGDKITWEETPELAEAVMISNRKRPLENDSCHGIMHRIFTAIRLRDLEYARALMGMLLNYGFVNRNLTTNHYPYRVVFPDMLGSMPAALAELLVFSKPGICTLLPGAAELMPKGRVTCLRMYNFARLEHLQWDSEKGVLSTDICSLKDQTLQVRFGMEVRECRVNGERVPLEQGVLHIALEAQRPLRVEAFCSNCS